MGRWNLSFGHLEGTKSRSKLVFQQVETTGKGLLILLGNLAAVCVACATLISSLCHKKQ